MYTVTNIWSKIEYFKIRAQPIQPKRAANLSLSLCIVQNDTSALKCTEHTENKEVVILSQQLENQV